MADWKQNSVLAIVIVLVCMIAVTMFSIIKTVLPGRAAYTAEMKCETCGIVFEFKITDRQRPPYKCSKCGKKTAYRSFCCMDCGKIFTYKPPAGERRPLTEAMLPDCPNCGARNPGPVTLKRKPD